MKFFEIHQSTAPEQVGMAIPQSQTAREPVPVNHPKHLWTQPFGPLVDVYLPEPVLHPNTKPSDLLSTTATWRLVMSERLKTIIERNASPGLFEFLEMKVHFLDRTLSYWMLNPLEYNMEVVDFAKSTLWKCGAGNQQIEQIEVADLASFDKLRKDYTMPERLSITKLVLLKGLNTDYLQLRNVPGAGYLVSERLKDAIEAAGCTGLRFIEFHQ